MLYLLVKSRIAVEFLERIQPFLNKDIKKPPLDSVAQLLSNLPVSATGLGIGLVVAVGFGAAAGLAWLAERQSPPKTTRRGSRKKTATAKAPTSKVPTSKIDKVHFTASSPHAVQPGKTFIVRVSAHTDQQRAEVERRVRQASPQPDALPVIFSEGPSPIERGTTLFVRLTFPEFHIGSPEEVIIWDDEIATASFEIGVPREIVEGMKTGSVTIHGEGGPRIAKVLLEIMVSANTVLAAPKTQTVLSHKKGFASYARQDLDQVLARVQGIEKGGIKVWIDVKDLRSGEDWAMKLQQVIPEHDVFYLFWSAAAKESSYVEKEWRWALGCRGEDFIDPVPLVSPKEVRPPEELAMKHFSDWELAYLSGQKGADATPRIDGVTRDGLR